VKGIQIAEGVMNDLLFSDYGIEVRKRDGRFFIRYDAGEVAVQMREGEISREEFLRVQHSEKEAHAVLLSVQQRSMK